MGEWIDVLNRELSGAPFMPWASNWSLTRIQEANAYAAQHGLRGFVAVSNNFSLAQMIDPVWPGCIAASDPAFPSILNPIRSHYSLGPRKRVDFSRGEPTDSARALQLLIPVRFNPRAEMRGAGFLTTTGNAATEQRTRRRAWRRTHQHCSCPRS
ncbi:MAG: hypothetical protein Ct9H300mP8_09950 [Gammaproteobacteria bacterium]|nr:MAG: hypothetical protein Ct9H300mP8_09950 [Gammaproteobacteria bacterium]